MSAIEAKAAGFGPPKRAVSKLIFATWQRRAPDEWLDDALYDTAKAQGATDTVLSDAFVVLERVAKGMTESGRGSLFDLQSEAPELMTRLCIETCARVDASTQDGGQECLL